MAESSRQSGPAPPAEPTPPAAKSREALSFGGSTSAYFRIWIVNVFLTIFTLGLYSPWAKVRRLKYLYRNTHLAGGSFDYHANPVAILKGRLIAFALLLCSSILSNFSILFGVAFSLLLPIVYPWLLVRSRMFNLHNTSYRNVRFGFAPVYGESYKLFFGGILLSVFTFGIAIPYVRHWGARMRINHSRFGTLGAQLDESVTPGRFYGIYLAGISGYFLLFLMMVLMYFSIFLAEKAMGENDLVSDVFAAVALSYLPFLIIFVIVNDAINRLVVGGIRIGGHSVHCGWSLLRLLWLRFTNLAAILLSLGLLIPWAAIRRQRYQTERLAVTFAGSLDDVIAVQQEEVSALGDEVGDAFDYDFGF